MEEHCDVWYPEEHCDVWYPEEHCDVWYPEEHCDVWYPEEHCDVWYPELVLIDATYKLNNLRMPLYITMVVDGNGYQLQPLENVLGLKSLTG